MEQYYRVVIKETSNSKSLVHENLNYSEMLKYYAKYKNGFQLKIYQREDNGFWAIEAIFENGRMVQFQDLKKENKPPVERKYAEPIDLDKIMKALFVDSAPSRREDVVSLVWDYATGEDLTKPKLKLLKK